jgi:flagellar hook-associated protein 3 FlgL
MTTISTSAFYNRANRDIASLRARAEALQASVGSGQRLARSSDDPLAASQLRKLARAESFAAIDTSVADRAMSDLTLTDGALSSFASYVTRIQELAVQAANGVLAPVQRESIATELEQLCGELIGLANARDSAGQALFGGETAGPAYTLDALGNPVYTGTASAGTLPLGDGQTVTRGLTGPEVLGSAPHDLFLVVRTLSDALRGAAPDPAQAARDALAPLGSALETITTQQTVVGTRLSFIELAAERRTAMSELRQEDQAELGGTDLTSAVMQLQQTMTVLEASQASFARLSSLSLFSVLG